MPDPIEIPVGSSEYVKGIVDADADLTMGVELSLTPLNADGSAGAHSWQPAVWVGDVSSRRLARTASTVAHSVKGDFRVHARLAATPESPILASDNEVAVI